MRDPDEMIVGLFPLELVLLPGEIVPLHIFEGRYKKLIGECREDDAEFGIVLREQESVTECGCTAAVVEVLEEADDGRLNILVEGRRRFRLDELIQPDDAEADYLRAAVTWLDDEEGDAPTEAVEEAGALFRTLVGLMGAEPPRLPLGEEPLSFRIGAAVDFGLPLKQRLLESTSETERIELLSAVMKTLIPGLELRRERQDAIRGNGKGN